MDLSKKKRFSGKLIKVNFGRFGQSLRTNKLWRRAGLAAAVLVVLAAIGWFAFDYFTAPARITKVQFERSLSSRTSDAPVKTEFAVGEPLMMVFEFEVAQTETSAKLEIYKGKDRVRSIDLPYLRGDKSSPDSGKRYISIVNGVSTKLEAGEYTTKLIVNGRVLKTDSVVIK